MDRTLARRSAVIMACIMAPSVGGLVFLLSPFPWARTVSFFAPRAAALPAWIAAAVIAAGYVGASARSLPYIASRFLDVTALKLLAVPFALITGAFEELFFRRYLMNLLAIFHHGAAVQVAVSALAFGAVHAVWGLFAGSWRAVLLPLAWTTGLGLALAGTYLLGGRDAAPCIWGHIAINLCLEPWLLLAVMLAAQERVRPPSMARDPAEPPADAWR